MKWYLVVLSMIISTHLISQNRMIDSNSTEKPKEPKIDLTMYPKLENMSKKAIILEPRENESALKIEIYAVKESEVDACNRHRLVGDFEKKNLEGWGYTYYVFNSNGMILSSKMACIDDKKAVKSIESSHNAMMDYSSRWPIVIYCPMGMIIKYRIWNLDGKAFDSQNIEE